MKCFDEINKFMQVNSTINIDLIMKDNKKEIFKELIIIYLLKQISEEK